MIGVKNHRHQCNFCLMAYAQQIWPIIVPYPFKNMATATRSFEYRFAFFDVSLFCGGFMILCNNLISIWSTCFLKHLFRFISDLHVAMLQQAVLCIPTNLLGFNL